MNANSFKAVTHPLAMAQTPTNRGGHAEVCADGREVTVVDAGIPPCVWGVDVSIALAIDLCPIEPCEGDPPFYAGVRAIVTWGIGGAANMRAVADWRRGAVLVVPAETVCVEAVYVAIGPDGRRPCGVEIPPAHVRAGLAYGSCCGSAQLTEPVFLSAKRSSTRVPVAAFAKSVAVLPKGNADLEVAIVGAGGMRTPVPPTFLFGNELPLPGDAAFVEVAAPSLAGDATTSAHVVFGLSL